VTSGETRYPLLAADTAGHSPSQTRCWKAVFRSAVREPLPASLARRRKCSRSGQFMVANLLEALERNGQPSTNSAAAVLGYGGRGPFHSEGGVHGETSAMVGRQRICFTSPKSSDLRCLAVWLVSCPSGTSKIGYHQPVMVNLNRLTHRISDSPRPNYAMLRIRYSQLSMWLAAPRARRKNRTLHGSPQNARY
jgi:hypothetical protein